MDPLLQVVVASAIDRSIASVAEEEFQRLSDGLSRDETARRIHNALVSLKGLQGTQMPDYDDWVSLFYALWYQPARINFAYTLSKLMPSSINPLLSGSGDLRVVDYGAGQLAMQFGLALAAGEARLQGNGGPSIFIYSTDENESMKKLGMEIWKRCYYELRDDKSTNLDVHEFAQGFNDVRFANTSGSDVSRWLTALHVAYPEIQSQVNARLIAVAELETPDLVLVTSHPGSSWCLHEPSSEKYELYCSREMVRNGLSLASGSFTATTDFRRQLCRDFIDTSPHSLSHEELSFAKAYLDFLSTSWYSNSNFRATWNLYVRRN